jgi:ankyrin repeat protein
MFVYQLTLCALNTQKFTALMGAAVSGNIELMQALVEAGANINAQDEQVWSCVGC